MSLLSIFTPNAPTMAGYEFDAVLEDTFEASVDLTGYTIELGARVSDHRIVNPFRWSIVGAISNTPLGIGVADGINTLASSLGGAIGGAVAGAASSYLAGGAETRSASALDSLVTLMTTGEPFDVDAGDIQLTNMVIVNLRRTKDPSNENGLIFEADLQEYNVLSTVLAKNGAQQDQLQEGDDAQTQAAAETNAGEVEPEVPNTALKDRLVNLLEEKGEGDSGWANILRGDGGGS